MVQQQLLQLADRGFQVPIDEAWFRWGSVAAFAVGVVLTLRFTPPDPQPAGTQPRRPSRRRDTTAYSLVTIVIATFVFFAIRAGPQITVWRKDPEFPQVADLPITLYSFGALSVLRLALMPLFARLGRALIPAAKFGAEHEVRVHRFAGQCFKVLFHSTVTILPLIFLRGQSWWPPGYSRFTGLWENHPHVPAVKWLREFYLFQLGYYLHALLLTLMMRTRPNYVQMTVHHVASIVLIVCSYFFQNNVRHGTIVLWVHDVCDIPVCLTRLVVDLPYVLPTAIFYVWLMISWAYYRLWVYPTQVVWVVVYTSLKEGWIDFANIHSFFLSTTMLVLLVGMHWMWFFELAQMASVYFRTGKREDSTDAHSSKTKSK